MHTYSLNIFSREKTGRGSARRLRTAGRIPAAVYGRGNCRSIAVSAVDFRNLNREIGGGAAVVELKDEKGGTSLSLVQEIQRDAVKDTINHIDFQEIERGHEFNTRVRVTLVKEADCVGVKNDGGVIDHQVYEVEIRCRPSKLPDHIPVDVSALEIGEAICIKDLPELEAVEYLGEPDQVIVSCQPPTVAAETTDDAEAVAADEVPSTKVGRDDDEAAGAADDSSGVADGKS